MADQGYWYDEGNKLEAVLFDHVKELFFFIRRKIFFKVPHHMLQHVCVFLDSCLQTQGLHEQRERLLADIGDEDGELRPALADFRETFETGRQLAVALNEALVSADGLVARVLEEEPARPFDILDYKETISEATITVRELHEVLARVERILGSEEIEGELTHVVDSAMRLEDEVINDIIDRAFVRGVALILIFFVALAV